MKQIPNNRQQLPKDVLLVTISELVRFIKSSVPVVHTYACHAIERILTIKAPASNNKESLFASGDLQAAAIAPTLIANILDILQPVSGENEYAIRLLMRVCMVLGEQVVPYLDAIIHKLIGLLTAISKNPSKPHFNHYLFETFGVLIRSTCAVQPQLIEKFESSLFPVFNYVLEQDISEFMPYAFQLLSMMLETHDQQIPSVYYELFPFLLMPVLWERPGDIPALVKLLQSYIRKAASTCVAEKIMAVLGVFQRLVASKTNDHFAFHILNSLTEHLPERLLSEYIKQILFLLFQRLNSSKTTKLVKNMLVFISLYSYKYGPANMSALVDNLQAG